MIDFIWQSLATPILVVDGARNLDSFGGDVDTAGAIGGAAAGGAVDTVTGWFD